MADVPQDRLPELRSKFSTHKSCVRFLNRTDRKVDVIWINYEGHHVKYKTLPPGSFYDVNTYTSHPWLFIDSETRDRLVVKSKEVYSPEPSRFIQLNQGNDIPPLAEYQRMLAHITIPLYTLRERALQVVRNALARPEDAYKLELPNSLQKELADLVRESSRTRAIATYQS